jgi:hypothetical protein
VRVWREERHLALRVAPVGLLADNLASVAREEKSRD